MSNRKKFSVCLNFTVGAFVILGMILALTLAEQEGYTPWYTRLFYFTQQSNLWIGVTALTLGILSLTGTMEKNQKVKDIVYLLKFIFTVSITITGIIFCCLLAPFADFDVWTFSSILTHVAVPVLSIADLFVDDTEFNLQRKHIFTALIPLAYYFVFASVLSLLKVDFGRGDTFPYFFFNYYSEVGLFGFMGGNPPQMGSVYWFIVIFALVLGLSYLYYKLHPARKGK